MRITPVLLGGLLLVPAAARAQRPAPPPTAAEIGAHLRILSSDLFEGRAPGTRGEALTTAYLVSQLQAAGLTPGVRGEWLQPVRIV
ncbi:MAG TPA: hypothetical protein VFX50_09670, partial [Gemmatimonadales bacterium]|nr:hypothetical protein [Gemmatimonadales bacterium]